VQKYLCTEICASIFGHDFDGIAGFAGRSSRGIAGFARVRDDGQVTVVRIGVCRAGQR
jgi:hypothetical protein